MVEIIRRRSPTRRVIVVHTPKCAGTSLARSLRNSVPPRLILFWYRHQEALSRQYNIPRWGSLIGPPKYPEFIPPEKMIIYGHFHADRFKQVWSSEDWKDALWVTLMREPIDRILSQFLNWKYAPYPAWASEVRVGVNNGAIGLIEFAKNRGVNRVFYRYFDGVDVRRFHHIIWQHDYVAGVAKLGEMIGVPLSPTSQNVSNTRPGYANEKMAILSDAKLMAELRHALRRELIFYERLRRTQASL